MPVSAQKLSDNQVKERIIQNLSEVILAIAPALTIKHVMEVIAEEEEEVLIANPAVIPQNAMLVTSALKK